MKINKISENEVTCFLNSSELEEYGLNVSEDAVTDEKLKDKAVQNFFDLTLRVRDEIAKEYNLPVQCVEYIDLTPEYNGATLRYSLNSSTAGAYNYLNRVLSEVTEYLSDSVEKLKQRLIFELVVSFLSDSLSEDSDKYFKTDFINIIKEYISREDIELYLTEELSSAKGYIASEVVKYINSDAEARKRYEDAVNEHSRNIVNFSTPGLFIPGAAGLSSADVNNFDVTSSITGSVNKTAINDSLNDDVNGTDTTDTGNSDYINKDDGTTFIENNENNYSDMFSDNPFRSFSLNSLYDDDRLNNTNPNQAAEDALSELQKPESEQEEDDTSSITSNFKETFSRLRESIPNELLDETDGDIRLGDYLDFLENIGDELGTVLNSSNSALDKIDFMKNKMEELKESNYKKTVGGKFNSIKDIENAIKRLNSWDKTRFSSSLYLTPRNKYILILSASAPDISAFNSCIAALMRDGTLLHSDKLQIPYIREHCETLIEDNAVEIISGDL